MVSGFLKKRYGIRRVMECCISFCMGVERHQARGVSILLAVMMRPREASVVVQKEIGKEQDVFTAVFELRHA